jgi:hypothetical protein
MPTNPFPIPTPQVTSGPEYAQEEAAGFISLQAHKHLGVSVDSTPQLDAPSINLSEDLTFNDTNATNLRSARFVSNGGALTGQFDVNAVYVVNGNLYYNNAAGIAVQITAGNQINFSNVLTISYVIQAVNVATWNVLNTDLYNLLDVNTSSTAVTINLPKASTVVDGSGNPLPGRFLYIKDSTGNAATNNITVNTSTGDQFETGASSIVINNNYGAVLLYTDGISTWFILPINNYFSSMTATFSAGSQLILQGTLEGQTGTIGGTLAMGAGAVLTVPNAGNIVITGANAVQSNAYEGITSTVAGGITTSVAQGISNNGVANAIFSSSAKGITTNAQNGIAPITGGSISDGYLFGGIIATIAGGIETTVPGGITLGGGATDQITFTTGRTKSAIIQLQPVVLPNCLTGTPSGTSSPYNGSSGWAQTTFPSFGAICLQSPYYTDLTINVSKIEIPMPIMHNGATLYSVELYFGIRSTSTRTPGTQLALQIYQNTISNGGVTLLGTGVATSSTYATSAVQSITAPITSLPTVSNTLYYYTAIIQDEYGTNAIGGNYFLNLVATFINIENYNFPV